MATQKTEKTEKTDTTLLRATVQNELADWFKSLEKEMGFKTHGELIEYFKNLHQQQKTASLEFSTEEEKIIGEATQTGITRDDLFKIGIMSEAKKRASMASTFNLVDMDNDILFDPKGSQDGKSLKTIAGIGEERISRTVTAVMAINDNATKKEQKSCITQGLIFTLCGVNRNSLNKYFALYETMISDHNLKHGLEPDSNRKGNGFNWLVELASLEHNLGIDPKVITIIAKFKDLGNK